MESQSHEKGVQKKFTEWEEDMFLRYALENRSKTMRELMRNNHMSVKNI